MKMTSKVIIKGLNSRMVSFEGLILTSSLLRMLFPSLMFRNKKMEEISVNGIRTVMNVTGNTSPVQKMQLYRMIMDNMKDEMI
jgi:hypothetical protein